MGRKNKPDEPWIVVPVLDQAAPSTMATATVPSSSADIKTSAVNPSAGVALVGLSGVDPLTGSSSTTLSSRGNTLLVGSSDGLIGGSGNNTLMGLQAGTSLIGNGGADLFVVQNKMSLDQAIGFTDGQDKVMLASGLTLGQLKITQKGQDPLISSQSNPVLGCCSNFLP